MEPYVAQDAEGQACDVPPCSCTDYSYFAILVSYYIAF